MKFKSECTVGLIWKYFSFVAMSFTCWATSAGKLVRVC